MNYVGIDIHKRYSVRVAVDDAPRFPGDWRIVSPLSNGRVACRTILISSLSLSRRRCQGSTGEATRGLRCLFETRRKVCALCRVDVAQNQIVAKYEMGKTENCLLRFERGR